MKATQSRVKLYGCVAVVCLFVVSVYHLTIFTTAAAAPLLFYLPGATLVDAIDPTETLTSGLERVLWGFAASVVVLILLGLVLNEVLALDRTTWIASSFGITAISLVFAWVRSETLRPIRRVAISRVAIRRVAINGVNGGFADFRNSFVALNCPNCSFDLSIEGQESSFKCTHCGLEVSTVQCDKCGTAFTTTQPRKCQCPHCLNTIRISSANRIPIGMIGVQGSSTQIPVEAPNLGAKNRLFGSRLQILQRGILVLPVGALLIGGVVDREFPSTSHSKLTATFSTAINLRCGGVDAVSSISYVSKLGTDGNYRVLVLGRVTNNADFAIHDVEVKWVVEYADLSTGPATISAISGTGSVSKGSFGNWGGVAASDDGPVPPVGVRVLQVLGSKSTCTT
jgi:hypothetical protein